MAVEGFRSDSAVRMLVTYDHACLEFISVQRVKEAADRYALLISDLNMRFGQHLLAGTQIYGTTHEWRTAFKKAYTFAYLP